MILVAGLGNPGKEYEDTKHNVGFLTVDEIGKRAGIVLSKKKFHSTFGEGYFGGSRLLLIKPETYMNKSGEAVASAQQFYGLPAENMLIVYDEMDLPVGTIRIKPGGGSAGHNGIKSIISRTGTSDFPRIRIGIGKPYSKSGGAGHVLSGFSESESELIRQSISTASDAVLEIIENGVESAMNKFNSRPKTDENTEENNSH